MLDKGLLTLTSYYLDHAGHIQTQSVCLQWRHVIRVSEVVESDDPLSEQLAGCGILVMQDEAYFYTAVKWEDLVAMWKKYRKEDYSNMFKSN